MDGPYAKRLIDSDTPRTPDGLPCLKQFVVRYAVLKIAPGPPLRSTHTRLSAAVCPHGNKDVLLLQSSAFLGQSRCCASHAIWRSPHPERVPGLICRAHLQQLPPPDEKQTK